MAVRVIMIFLLVGLYLRLAETMKPWKAGITLWDMGGMLYLYHNLNRAYCQGNQKQKHFYLEEKEGYQENE